MSAKCSEENKEFLDFIKEVRAPIKSIHKYSPEILTKSCEISVSEDSYQSDCITPLVIINEEDEMVKPVTSKLKANLSYQKPRTSDSPDKLIEFP